MDTSVFKVFAFRFDTCTQTDETAAVIYTLISPSHDVTLMQIFHGKGSTYFGNFDGTSHRIIACSGLESFVYTNRILTKLCRWKLRGPVIMNHRVDKSASRTSRILHWHPKKSLSYGLVQCYRQCSRCLWFSRRSRNRSQSTFAMFVTESWLLHMIVCYVQNQNYDIMSRHLYTFNQYIVLCISASVCRCPK